MNRTPGTSPTREFVFEWLRDCDRTELTFSDLSRVFVTNRHKQRARSLAARDELRQVLQELESEGVVGLTSVRRGRGGRGLLITIRDPNSMYPLTQEGGTANVER